jgi:hypothetical protein
MINLGQLGVWEENNCWYKQHTAVFYKVLEYLKSWILVLNSESISNFWRARSLKSIFGQFGWIQIPTSHFIDKQNAIILILRGQSTLNLSQV